MKDYLIYLIVRAFSVIFSLIPTKIILSLARFLARVIYIIYPNRKEVAYSNLLIAFGSSKSPYVLKNISRETFINLFQTVIEILRMVKIDKSYLEKYIEISGISHIKNALREQKGVIIITAHFGNWELLSISGALLGIPAKVLAREQKPLKVNEMLNFYRESKGSKVIKKGFEIREIIKALYKNECIGILADQDAGKNGFFIDFFGKPASTSPGAFLFSYKTKAKIIPAFSIRKNGPYHKMKICSPLDIDYNLKKENFIKDGLSKYSRILEDYICKYPSQWLWFHKRWKSTPPVYILILNDGKIGHLKQSRIVAEQLKDVVEKYNSEFKVNIREININFKNRKKKFLLNLFSNFSNYRNSGFFTILKNAVTYDCYKKLTGSYADIIISCGSSGEGISCILKKQYNCRNIIIMKPAITKLKNFNLAIIPEHDNPKPYSNVVVTPAALNFIDKESIRVAIENLKTKGYKISDSQLRIGFLVGGDNKKYIFSKDIMSKVLIQLLELTNKLDARLLVTTSRRTPKHIDSLIKEKLENHSNCEILVIANDNNITGIVPAILGLCKIVIVSGESISMVTEAASSDSNVLVFNPIDNRINFKKDKHMCFLKNMDKNNYIKLVSCNHIGYNIIDFLENKKQTRRLDNISFLKKQLHRFI